MLSPTVTSKLVSEIFMIVQVTVSPNLMFSNSLATTSLVNCLIPKETLSFSTFISRTLVFIFVNFV